MNIPRKKLCPKLEKNVNINPNTITFKLKFLNIKTRKTYGNFTLIETTEEKAEKISNHLMNDGIIIRRLNSYNLPNFLRISIGTKEEMNLTVESLKKFNV